MRRYFFSPFLTLLILFLPLCACPAAASCLRFDPYPVIIELPSGTTSCVSTDPTWESPYWLTVDAELTAVADVESVWTPANHIVRSGFQLAADVLGDTLNPIDRTLGILVADTTREIGSKFEGPTRRIRLRLVEILSGNESVKVVDADYFPEKCNPLKAGDRAVVFIYTINGRPFVVATDPFLPHSIELEEAVAAMAHARLKAKNRTRQTPREWMCDTKISCPTLSSLWCSTDPDVNPYQPQFYECSGREKPDNSTATRGSPERS